jgi:hypothetical protein
MTTRNWGMIFSNDFHAFLSDILVFCLSLKKEIAKRSRAAPYNINVSTLKTLFAICDVLCEEKKLPDLL